MQFWTQPRQSKVRQALFQVHLWSGIAIGLYLIVICLTGSILVYRYEIEHAIAPGLNRVEVAPGRADLQAVYEELKRRYPHLTFQQMAIPDSPERAWFWRTRDKDNNRVYLYFHPNTGQILGAEEHKFLWMQWVYDLHVYLLLGKPGLVPNGIGGALLFLLCVSGLVVWWPGIKNWRFGFRYAAQAGWRRQNYDLHKLTGIASFLVLAVIALSGVYYCFPNESRAFIGWASGHPMLVDPILTGRPKPKQLANLNDVYAEAERALPGGRVWALSIPQRPDSPFTYRKIYPGDWHRAGDHWVFLDAESGKLIQRENTSDFPWGTRLIKSMAPLHFGTWGGHPSRVLYIAMGFGAALLAVSGYLMYWNRVLSKRWNKLQ